MQGDQHSERIKLSQQDMINQFIENWRSIRRERNQAVIQFEEKAKKVQQLSENADEIHINMLAGFHAQIKDIKREVRAARLKLNKHLEGKGIIDSVSFEWHREKKLIRKEIDEKEKQVRDLSSSVEFRAKDFYKYARIKSEENRLLNKKALKKLNPLIEKIKSLNLILEAVDKQDEAVAHCITQNDIGYALRIAKIWKRKANGEALGEGDVKLYGSALRGEIEPEKAEREHIAMLENAAFWGEALKNFIGQNQKNSGNVIDGSFEEVKPIKTLRLEGDIDQFSDI